MKTIRLISLIARVALMVTLGLGLLFWIAQLFVWIGLLVLPAQIGFPGIHEGFGTLGVLGLLTLGTLAVFTKGSRLLGVGGMIYAFLVPAFGLTQTLILVGNLHWVIRAAHLLLGIGAMVLIRRIEKRYQHLKLQEYGMISERPLGALPAVTSPQPGAKRRWGDTSRLTSSDLPLLNRRKDKFSHITNQPVEKRG